MTKRDDIFQVIDGEPFNVGWRVTMICCGCSLVHDEIYSVRTNSKTGKKELWCKSTRNPTITRRLRRAKSKSK